MAGNLAGSFSEFSVGSRISGANSCRSSEALHANSQILNPRRREFISPWAGKFIHGGREFSWTWPAGQAPARDAVYKSASAIPTLATTAGRGRAIARTFASRPDMQPRPR
jgi:hypothetical protein